MGAKLDHAVNYRTIPSRKKADLRSRPYVGSRPCRRHDITSASGFHQQAGGALPRVAVLDVISKHAWFCRFVEDGHSCLSFSMAIDPM
jgi:hypothetical protein